MTPLSFAIRPEAVPPQPRTSRPGAEARHG
jgi:hypothetical protein